MDDRRLQELLIACEEHAVTSIELDDAVRELKAQEAARINGAGLEAQVRFLRQAGVNGTHPSLGRFLAALDDIESPF